MKDKTLKILAIIMVLFYLVGLSIAIYKIIIWEEEYKDCYYEEYMEYPCEGATHYARVHRNSNEPCKRVKIICKEVK